MHIRLEAEAVGDSGSVRFETRLAVVVREDDQAKVFVSHAPALNLYSQGPTVPEAVRALEHAVRLYIVTAHGRGYLGRVLRRSTLWTSDDPRVPPPRQYVRVVHGRRDPEPVDAPAAVERSTR